MKSVSVSAQALGFFVAAAILAGCGSDEDDGTALLTGASSGAGGHAGAGAGGTGAGGGMPELPTGRAEIGFWCGVPASEMTKARFDEIAAAGFTFANNACDGSTFNPTYNAQMLELAHQAGLEALVADSRVSTVLAGQGTNADLDALV